MTVFNKKYFIITLILFSISLDSCTENNFTNQNDNQSDKLQNISNTEATTTKEFTLVDSSKLITNLYKDRNIISSKDYSNFTYSVNFDKKESIIQIKSTNTLGGYKVNYFIILKDTLGIYSENQFSTFDDSYKYIKSYFEIDGKKLDLTNVELSNLTGEKVVPSLLWYDQHFGISAKYYNVKDKEYFLIQGLDLYCNGSQCTDYQVFIINKSKEDFQTNAFYFSGLYPYTFENTFLFDEDKDGNFEFFVPKDVKKLDKITDFNIYELEFPMPVKIK